MEELYSRDFSEYEKKIVERALQAYAEDFGTGDITTEAVLEDVPAKATIIAEGDYTD